MNFSWMPSRNPFRTTSTFSEDTQDRAILDATLSLLCQKAMKRLREAGLSASTVTVDDSLRGI